MRIILSVPSPPFLLAVFMACSGKFVSWVSSPEEKGKANKARVTAYQSTVLGFALSCLSSRASVQ